jgi:hypothetical protein
MRRRDAQANRRPRQRSPQRALAASRDGARPRTAGLRSLKSLREQAFSPIGRYCDIAHIGASQSPLFFAHAFGTPKKKTKFHEDTDT